MIIRAADRLLWLGTILGVLVLAAALWAVPVPALSEPADQLVILLDSSGSMREPAGRTAKIAAAKTALDRVIARLPDGARVGLRVYGATVFDRRTPGACTDSQLLVPIGVDNRRRLRRAVARVRPYGESPIAYSLQRAAADLGAVGRRSIILVSDGQETCSADPCQTAAEIAAAGADVKIDVVGFRVGPRARGQLSCIAAVGNGTYYDTDDIAGLEDSLTKLATRAFRPFRFSGAAVRGTGSAAGAPNVGLGQFTDTVHEAGRPQYYRVGRTIPSSTLHVGFTSRPHTGRVDVVAASLTLETESGQRCDRRDTAFLGVDGDPLLTGAVRSSGSLADEDCASAGRLVLRIDSSGRVGDRFEIVVIEEPPLADSVGLPEPGPAAWKPMGRVQPKAGVVPGSSLSDAPVVRPGSYALEILSGETQVVAVELDWGQRLQAEVQVPPPRRPDADRLIALFDDLQLQVIAPTRGSRTRAAPAESQTRVLLQGQTTTLRARWATPPVAYLNREAQLANAPAGADLSDESLPGRHFVAVTISPGNGAWLRPYTLRLQVIGVAGTGRPHYRVASPSPSVDRTITVGPLLPREPRAALPVVAVVGTGVAVVAALVVTGLLGRRRDRARRRPPGP